MRLAISTGGTAAEKARGVVASLPGIWEGIVVDVGCRTREIDDALAGVDHDYVGVDIHGGADTVADLGRGLPFGDRAADVVTALDVLEHTNDIHHAFAELCRVARHHIVITLPNLYELGVRLRILRGRHVSKKYGLPRDPPDDRHRWFFSMTEAQRFVHDNAKAQGWRVIEERSLVGPRRARLAPLVRRWPNLLAPTYLVLIAPAK